jgi:hypothetical protein
LPVDAFRRARKRLMGWWQLQSKGRVKLLRDTADYYDSIYCMSVTVHWWIVYTCIHGMTVCVLTCMLSLMLIGISIHDCIPVE